MKENVGSIDRVLRIVAGIALLAFAIVGPETNYNAFGYIGIIPLVTATVGWCPLYSIFNLKT